MASQNIPGEKKAYVGSRRAWITKATRGGL